MLYTSWQEQRAMQAQIWTGAFVATILSLAVASEWIQLPMVEPGGKTKVKPRPFDVEEEFHTQLSEANKQTDGIEMKDSSRNPINHIPETIQNDQITINKIMKQNIVNDQSGTQTHNPESNNFNNNDPTISSQTSTSADETHTSYDSMINSHDAQKTDQTVVFLQPPHQWPFESLIETEENSMKMPHFQVHLTTSNLNPSNLQQEKKSNDNAPKPDLDITSRPDTTSEHQIPDVLRNDTNPDTSNTDTVPKVTWISKQEIASNSSKENVAYEATSPFEMLRSVHQTLIQETPNTMKGKMNFLQQMKNKMLHYMEKRIKSLWTNDSDRQARTEKGMAFPSMEGALMSISFLIFAVFLIKLVQQLIQSLQGNNMAMMSRRQTRSVPDLLTTARVLQLIDEFPFQYEGNGWS